MGRPTAGSADLVMEAIIDSWNKNKYSPSFREIATHVKDKTGETPSTSSITRWLRELQDDNKITYQWMKARTIVPTNLNIVWMRK